MAEWKDAIEKATKIALDSAAELNARPIPRLNNNQHEIFLSRLRPGLGCVLRLRTSEENQELHIRKKHKTARAPKKLTEDHQDDNGDNADGDNDDDAETQEEIEANAARNAPVPYPDDDTQRIEDDMANDEMWDDATFATYLVSLNEEIYRKYSIQPMPQPENIIMQGHSYQNQAAGWVREKCAGRHKGVIIADPPGFGKTLTAIMATVGNRKQIEDGIVMIVVPASLIGQWMGVLERVLQKRRYSICHLQCDTISFSQLGYYDIILTSYQDLVADRAKNIKYMVDLQAYEDGESMKLPERPKVCLFADALQWGRSGPVKLGKYLILDEAHYMKNLEGQTYAACRQLREHFESCIMMTGTPLNITWMDGYTLISMLKDHPITAPHRMRLAFTSPNQQVKKGRIQAPSGTYRLRYGHFLDGVAIRRPLQMIEDTLPPKIFKAVEFDLTEEERKASNDHFEEYLQIRRAVRNGAVKFSAAVGSLIKAQQCAYHPALQQLIELDRRAIESCGNSHEDMYLSRSEAKKIAGWRKWLAKDGNWKSSRIQALIATIKEDLELETDARILIFDEGTFFLDIIKVALKHGLDDPPPILQFDGRIRRENRQRILTRFNEHQGPVIMLTSRAAGGTGLNLQAANVVIRCGPWWFDDEHADAQVHRNGQTRDVRVYQLMAKDCMVDLHKASTRKQKRDVSASILSCLERRDGVEPNLVDAWDSVPWK